MKNLIATIPYSEVNFKWISDHWDIHLNGTCIYNNKTCEFKTIAGEYKWNKETEEVDVITEDVCEIYSLDEKDKKEWLCSQKKFELCVGYHWTYPYRKTGEKQFHYRNPKWFYKLLFNLYYLFK